MKIPEILLVETFHKPGSLASVLTVIAEERLAIEHLQSLRREQGRTLWEITVEIDEQANPDFYSKIDALPNARFVGKSDRVFNRHKGGKIHMQPTLAITTQQILRDIYTPGVARVCLAIRDDPSKAALYTNLPRTVAVVTNGTAILGLGDIGPVAGLPVMEGKSALFAALVGITAVPILIDSHDPDRIVETIVNIAPSFGAIQLEDIAAPECFTIESELVRRLKIPVLHDDQHGTAVVALAALLNATKRVGRSLGTSVIGQVGLGAAGLGIARLLRAQGVQRMLGADLRSEAMERFKALGGEAATLPEVMAQADVIVATTGVKGLIKPEWVRPGQIVFALSNPDAEIDPMVALERGAVFAADGKGINNVAAFPGLFEGALEAAATRFTDGMLVAAAHALAKRAGPEELLPDPLNLETHRAVTAAVRQAAIEPVSTALL
ncbi:MAG: NADP-dependent malic enzyme [Gammaproteobacteria bacterium]|nr:NADP-dependent malic enzyme [Gammaproteobacteria bacterium]MDH5227401.1 NADP-dependent malic enzyme [Gammaproteobacteria bacterium]